PINNANYVRGNAVTVDGSGNIYVTGGVLGYSTVQMDFGGGPTNGVGSEMFVAKYTRGNSLVWVKQFGTSASGSALAIDRVGNVVVTGMYQATINFGGQTFTNAPANGPVSQPKSIFVANSAAGDGSHIWSRR